MYADSGATSSFVLPAPRAVATALWNNAGFIAGNLGPTAVEVALGIALALALGFALAVLIHFSDLLRRAVYPLAVGSQAVPIAVIAPLLVFWWGFRRAAEARSGRADLLLPRARHDGRRPRAHRARSAQAAAHARRLALAGVSLRRAAGGACRRRSAARASRWRSA